MDNSTLLLGNSSGNISVLQSGNLPSYPQYGHPIVQAMTSTSPLSGGTSGTLGVNQQWSHLDLTGFAIVGNSGSTINSYADPTYLNGGVSPFFRHLSAAYTSTTSDFGLAFSISAATTVTLETSPDTNATKYIQNYTTSTAPLTIAAGSGTSLAAQPILLPGQSILLQYDSIATAWRGPQQIAVTVAQFQPAPRLSAGRQGWCPTRPRPRT